MNKLILSLLIPLMISPTMRAQSNNMLKPESKEEFHKRMSWFKEAKYGMFIHFGLYSQLGGEWNGEKVEWYAEWIQATANIPSSEYAALLETFNPINFNAELIVKTAKDAGMKYLVITSKHHEGFCLWDSKYTDFDIASTPLAGRDLLKELNLACKKYGLKFCTYYSIIDWHHPSQTPNIKSKNKKNKRGQILMKPNKKKEYINYMKNQIRELVENYNTSLIWFDGDWVDWWDMDSGQDLYNYVRSLDPKIIVNNRVAKRKEFKKDFGTPEQEHPEEPIDYQWEACYTLNNSWGYKKSDNDWKSSETVISKLRDINSKGGNFLLNIGPDGTGNIPKESLEILLEAGKILNNN